MLIELNWQRKSYSTSRFSSTSFFNIGKLCNNYLSIYTSTTFSIFYFMTSFSAYLVVIFFSFIFRDIKSDIASFCILLSPGLFLKYSSKSFARVFCSFNLLEGLEKFESTVFNLLRLLRSLSTLCLRFCVIDFAKKLRGSLL